MKNSVLQRTPSVRNHGARLAAFVVSAVFMTIIPTRGANADLIAPVTFVNNAFQFHGKVDDTVLTFGLVLFAGANWSVTATQDDFQFFGFGATDDICVTAQHMVAPPGVVHAADVAPNPNVLTACLFNVVPGAAAGPDADVEIHDGPPNHFDILNIVYAPLVAGVSSRLTINARHSCFDPRFRLFGPAQVEPACELSEPGILGLLLCGLLGLIAFRWREAACDHRRGARA